MLTYHAQRYTIQLQQLMFPGWLSNKASACQAGDAGDMGSIPGSERSLEGGNGNPLLFLPGKILWSDEPSRLHSMGLQSRT